MSPYYQDESVTLYHGDCLEGDAWLAADTLVTDPPYGMAFKAGRRFANRSQAWTSRWAGVPIAGDETTAARDQALAAWGDRPALVFGTWKRPMPPGVREVLVWDKVVSTGMGALDIPWRPSWESIYVIGSGFRGSRGHGVIQCSLPTLAPEGSPHHQAGAKQLGRQAIGVEIDERYCEVIAKRLSQGVLDFGEAS